MKKRQPPAGPSPMMTSEECAHRMGVSLPTWRRWAANGQVPKAIKLGVNNGTVRWSRDEIEEWIAGRPRAGSAA